MAAPLVLSGRCSVARSKSPRAAFVTYIQERNFQKDRRNVEKNVDQGNYGGRASNGTVVVNTNGFNS